MNKYEVVYIIDPAVEEEARKELIAKFNELITGNGGSVDKVEEWGKRRLAYAIDYKTEGYYVLVNLFLMFFNLLPIPPLDGSCIYVYLVPRDRMDIYYKIEQYAMPVLLILLFVIPYILPVSPISIYMGATAGNLANLIYPFPIY